MLLLMFRNDWLYLWVQYIQLSWVTCVLVRVLLGRARGERRAAARKTDLGRKTRNDTA